MLKIRLFKPSVGIEEINNIRKVFKRSWLGYGPLVKKFEEKFSIFTSFTFLNLYFFNLLSSKKRL